MSPDRLIYMANQSVGSSRARAMTRRCLILPIISKILDPRMRKAIFAHLDGGGAGLDPNVRDALETLKQA